MKVTHALILVSLNFAAVWFHIDFGFVVVFHLMETTMTGKVMIVQNIWILLGETNSVKAGEDYEEEKDCCCWLIIDCIFYTSKPVLRDQSSVNRKGQGWSDL